MPTKVRNAELTLEVDQPARRRRRSLVVDRDLMGSHLLADALKRELTFDATGIQASRLIEALGKADVDLVVIAADLDTGRNHGLKLASAVGHAFPDAIVVVLLDQSTREAVVNAFRSGARGVISRQQPLSEFLQCVEHVAGGFIWAGREETNLLLDALRNIPAAAISTESISSPLTKRELQVVQYAAEGKTNKAIARELRLSEHTVKNYLFRAYEKLGVSSRIELLFYLTTRGNPSMTIGRYEAGADIGFDLYEEEEFEPRSEMA